MKISRFFLVAIFGFALTFTLSCSSDDGGGDGDKGKSYGPGCQVGNTFCMEEKDGMALREESCSREEEEFKPEGCPTDWKVRCIHPSIDYMVMYFYNSEMYDAAIKTGYRSCTKK